MIVGTMSSIPESLSEDIDVDCDSSRSSSTADSDSDSSLDSEEMNMEVMSTSQFMFPVKIDDESPMFGFIPPDDDDPTPTSSIQLSPSIPSSISSISSTSHQPPTITVVTAGIELSYARDPYSPSAISHLLPANMTEDQFATVVEGDALEVLEELTDYLWIVRVCRTDKVGIIPAWNVEGEFERTARINMEYNSRSLSPVAEFPSPLNSPSMSSEDGSSGPTTPCCASSDEPSPALDDSIFVTNQLFYDARKVRTVDGPKSVGFASAGPQVVFRYPSETYIYGRWDEEVSKVEDRVAVWSGWLEGEEDVEPSSESSTRRKPRSRRRNKGGMES